MAKLGRRKKAQIKCSFAGCDRISSSIGLCHSHYMQKIRGNELTPIRDFPVPLAHQNKTCIVDGCGRPTKTRGLCGAHYQRSKRGMALDLPISKKVGSVKGKICSVDGCGKSVSCKGLCRTHYSRLWLNGTTDTDSLMDKSTWAMWAKQSGKKNVQRPYLGRFDGWKHWATHKSSTKHRRINSVQRRRIDSWHSWSLNENAKRLKHLGFYRLTDWERWTNRKQAKQNRR